MADQEEDQGITAYHGSPHEFEQFDTAKIGTGEGAQAYGHGLYFAENEPVAQEYRDALSGHHLYYEQDPFDKKYYVINSKNEEVQHHSDTEEEAKNFINQHKKQGHMYQVAINAHPDHFLDWDKPLSEQSEHVKNAVINHAKLSGFEHYTPQGENAPVVLNKGISGDTVGNNLYKWFGDGNAEKASQMLNFYGIKGIKYLDADSRPRAGRVEMLSQTLKNLQDRGASQAAIENTQRELEAAQKGLSRNYVVFDDKLVNVKRRYEQGGAVLPPVE